MTRRFNWQLWSGLLLAVVAPLSYFLFFVRFEPTRDVPWPSFLLFVAAIWLLVSGWRRAARKILPSIVAALGLFLFGAFTYLVTVATKQLPVAEGAPALGANAPDFALPDTANRSVSLASTLARSNGVLLVFYRGHW